jgi:hypothetical protein
MLQEHEYIRFRWLGDAHVNKKRGKLGDLCMIPLHLNVLCFRSLIHVGLKWLDMNTLALTRAYKKLISTLVR